MSAAIILLCVSVSNHPAVLLEYIQILLKICSGKKNIKNVYGGQMIYSRWLTASCRTITGN